MRAIIINSFGAPSVFELGEIDKPTIKQDEILVRCISGSVNPIDWKQRRGNHKWFFGSNFPIVLGYDIAGEVVETGKEVRRIKKGDLVCGVLSSIKYGGGLAEYAKAHEDCFEIIPDTNNQNKFAALPLAGLTALQALRDKAKIKSKEKALIIGAAGGVGHYACQIAAILGASVTVVSSLPHKSFIDSLGNFEYIDYKEQNILRLNQKFDCIIDAVGKYSFMKCHHMLNPSGRYVTTLPRPKILIHKFLSLFTKNKKAKALLMKKSPSDLKTLINWVMKKELGIMVTKTFNIKDVEKSHEHGEKGKTEGKLLIDYNW